MKNLLLILFFVTSAISAQLENGIQKVEKYEWNDINWVNIQNYEEMFFLNGELNSKYSFSSGSRTFTQKKAEADSVTELSYTKAYLQDSFELTEMMVKKYNGSLLVNEKKYKKEDTMQKLYEKNLFYSSNILDSVIIINYFEGLPTSNYKEVYFNNSFNKPDSVFVYKLTGSEYLLDGMYYYKYNQDELLSEMLHWTKKTINFAKADSVEYIYQGTNIEQENHFVFQSNPLQSSERTFIYSDNKLVEIVESIDASPWDGLENHSKSVFTYNENVKVKFAEDYVNGIIPTDASYKIVWHGNPDLNYNIYLRYPDGLPAMELIGSNISGNSFDWETSENTLIGRSFYIESVESNQDVDYSGTFDLLNIDFDMTPEVMLQTTKLAMPFNNKGILGDVSVPGYSQVNGRFNGVPFLFSGGFLLSSANNGEGNIYGSGVASASLIQNFKPGMVGSDHANPLNSVFLVKQEDAPFGDSWKKWAIAVHNGAGFIDNGDGIYNPVDLNGNGIWDEGEDKPEIIGDITAYTLINDGVSGSTRLLDFEPLGIEIGITISLFEDDTYLGNVCLVKFNVVNKSETVGNLDENYFSFWSDIDLSDDFTNDLVGTDTLNNSVFVYNEDNSSESKIAVYKTLLKGPKNNSLGITSSMYYISSHPEQGDPNTVGELYNYIRGYRRFGEKFDVCNYHTVLGNEDCSEINPHFIFSGDPVTQTGWIDIVPTDVRIMLNTGHFPLVNNQNVEMIFAYILGEGDSQINALANAKSTTSQFIDYFNENLLNTDDEPLVDIIPKEFVLHNNYPNPFNPSTKIEFQLPSESRVKVEIINILGQRVELLSDGVESAGVKEIVWNASGLASGIYFIKVSGYSVSDNRNFEAIKKAMLMK